MFPKNDSRSNLWSMEKQGIFCELTVCPSSKMSQPSTGLCHLGLEHIQHLWRLLLQLWWYASKHWKYHKLHPSKRKGIGSRHRTVKKVVRSNFCIPQWKGNRGIWNSSWSAKAISKDTKNAIANTIIRLWCREIDVKQLHEVMLICLPKK